MASQERLMGVGVPNEAAVRIGFFIQTLETNQTINGPGNHIVRVSGTTLNLGSAFDLGDELQIMFVTAGTVYPSSTNIFNLKATGSAMVCSAGIVKYFTKYTSTQWMVSDATA